jgi:uncharacterized membrane protein YkvA (DUF1232 family)
MRRLLALLWRVSRSDLQILWLALRSPARPGWLLPATFLLAVYAVSPFSYAIPLLGLVDDFVLVPLALHWLVRMLPGQLQPAPRR